MKSRFLATALAMVMVFGMTSTVFAAAEGTTITAATTDQSHTVNVQYTVSQSYEVTIPADVTFESDKLSQKESVSASKVLIENGKQLTVSVTSTNGYKLIYEGSEIPYTVTLGDSTSALSGSEANTILTLAAGTTEKTTELTFDTTGAKIAAATKAGDHKDTLTFAVAVTDVAAATE